MLNLLLYCLSFAWDPAPGPVATYTLSLDGTEIESGITSTTGQVCVADQLEHVVTVQAFDSGGVPGPMSDESDIMEMVLGDPFHMIPLSTVVQADMNGDGVVGISDFGIWATQYRKCHDTMQEIPCN